MDVCIPKHEMLINICVICVYTFCCWALSAHCLEHPFHRNHFSTCTQLSGTIELYWSIDTVQLDWFGDFNQSIRNKTFIFRSFLAGYKWFSLHQNGAWIFLCQDEKHSTIKTVGFRNSFVGFRNCSKCRIPELFCFRSDSSVHCFPKLIFSRRR